MVRQYYCTYCGTKMSVNGIHSGFDGHNGMETFHMHYRCPNRNGIFTRHQDFTISDVDRTPIDFYEDGEKAG